MPLTGAAGRAHYREADRAEILGGVSIPLALRLRIAGGRSFVEILRGVSIPLETGESRLLVDHLRVEVLKGLRSMLIRLTPTVRPLRDVRTSRSIARRTWAPRAARRARVASETH